MLKGGRQTTKAFFIALGTCTVALAVTLNISWIVLYWRTGLLLVLGMVFFTIIITGLVLNTIFLVREIRRNEQHDAFINAVTHELKTPVASMRLYLQTLQSRDVGEAKRREFYDTMMADSDRLLNTIEQVLRAARNHSHRKVERVAINLSEVVHECIELALKRHQVPENAIRLEGSIADAQVMGDPEELKAAISNLLDNAVKYSRAQVAVSVQLDRSRDGKFVVRVRDQGVGIPPNELKRIFKRFYRIPGHVGSRVKGTGLGLFIVRSVAERHGGRAYAQSAGTGQGSTFTLELPSKASQS